MCNDEAGAFCKPHPPYGPAGTLHVAGLAGHTAYNAPRTSGSKFYACVRHVTALGRPTLAASPPRAQLRAA